MPEAVLLDASAVLALLHEEPGSAQVAAVLPAAAIGAVNLAEVLIVLERHGVPPADARRAVDALALDVLRADDETARAAAVVAAAGRPARSALSLGDCFCLATARLTGRTVLTADRAWAGLRTGVKVVVVR